MLESDSSSRRRAYGPRAACLDEQTLKRVSNHVQAEAALMTELEERILLSSQQQPASEEDVSEPADADSESAAAESQAEGDKPRLSR